MDVSGESVVLVNQSSGFLVVDDLNAYCLRYERVSLISGCLPRSIRPLNPKVKVDLICRYDKSGPFKRMSTWLIGSIQVFFKLLVKYRHYDVVYYTNPPMACFSALVLRNRFRIVEYDIYPDALKTIGIGSKSLIFRLWARAKKKLYAKSDKVFTLSEGMKELLSAYGDSAKIKVVPLWSAFDDLKPISKETNPFVKEHNLEGRFIVLYSGNIGYTHCVEQLVEVAKLLKSEESIEFLIVGDGKKKQVLVREVEMSKLTNVTFLPYQDAKMLPFSLACADVGVVTLDENVSSVSVPSKTFNLMAVGAPLLAIASEKSELSRLIEKYRNGGCFRKEQVQAIVNFILQLKNDASMRTQMANNSVGASKNFTYKNAELYVN